MTTTSSQIPFGQRGSRFTAALFALTLSTACAFDAQTPIEEGIDSSDSAITNAHVDGPAFIVNLNGGCTGSVISQHYILTAAHCFGRTAPFAMTVRDGLRSEGIAFSGTADVVVHPSWSAGSSDREAWDIAVVRLFGNGLGASYPRGRIYAGPETPWTSRGGTFYVSGYGRGTDPGGAKDCSGAGGGSVKRGGNFAFLGEGRRSGSTWLSAQGYSSLRTTCNGDSGAPYILPRNGEDFVFAVHSGSMNVAKGTIRATLLQPKMDWIRTTSASMGLPLACALTRDHRVTPSIHYYNCTERPAPLTVQGVALQRFEALP